MGIQIYLSFFITPMGFLEAIDDVTKNAGMVEFIQAYQGFLIDHYDVRLLMSGLAKNVSKLESDRSLTFLFRAPKIQLPPLFLKAIALSYQETFHVKEDESIKLAKATKGYAMAYQILGDILFRTKKVSLTQKVLQEYDLNLGQWSYEIIWSELTEKEKEILSLIADGICTNKDLQDHLNVNKGCLSIYKKKLSQEGLLNTSIRGKSELALPRFGQFIQMKKEWEDE